MKRKLTKDIMKDIPEVVVTNQHIRAMEVIQKHFPKLGESKCSKLRSSLWNRTERLMRNLQNKAISR